MPYQTLDLVLNNLNDKGRSAKFMKLLHSAVREGRVDAAYLPGRVEIPATTRSNSAAPRTSRNMIIEITPAFDAWFAEVNAELTGPERKPAVTLEAFESGELSFEQYVQETRRLLNSKYERGQQLGRSTKAAREAKTRSAKGAGARSKKAASATSKPAASARSR
ncbi:hypothetical protein [Deinococcus soli (ex Cha et al. 2016)]|uniref:Uncharacterized protein n=2 Tax=Deinococcus soli (ex Cha et al. 2016) TaxID=1309411 RepID=A0AAE3XC24_9DEIO|nr:hypothetical protein [Deinococcus soli (ex Cha et al. 2016)]MDR6218281.1 hypothetical protein [Deinococcus soli (ex Cha et al. 2016)]MDR6329021.1 hypothetical protein [Deinococcus soli (ex Cha et al. 2016)]MDR6751294.1 hypothetical protein [Deinococcus soli (ex Cha et al. 2016)]